MTFFSEMLGFKDNDPFGIPVTFIAHSSNPIQESKETLFYSLYLSNYKMTIVKKKFGWELEKVFLAFAVHFFKNSEGRGSLNLHSLVLETA